MSSLHLGACRREADSNLRLALILAPMLLTAGHSVKLSRQTDEFVYTYHRAKMAWEWGADLLISLHCDSASSPKPCGHHVICSVIDKPGERSNKLAWLLVQGIAEATGRPPFKRSGGPVWSKPRDAKTDWYGLIRYAVQYGWMAPVIIEQVADTRPNCADGMGRMQTPSAAGARAKILWQEAHACRRGHGVVYQGRLLLVRQSRHQQRSPITNNSEDGMDDDLGIIDAHRLEG